MKLNAKTKDWTLNGKNRLLIAKSAYTWNRRMLANCFECGWGIWDGKRYNCGGMVQGNWTRLQYRKRTLRWNWRGRKKTWNRISFMNIQWLEVKRISQLHGNRVVQKSYTITEKETETEHGRDGATRVERDTTNATYKKIAQEHTKNRKLFKSLDVKLMGKKCASHLPHFGVLFH